MSRQSNWEKTLEGKEQERRSWEIDKDSFLKLQDQSGPGFVVVNIETTKKSLEEFEREGLRVTVYYTEEVPLKRGDETITVEHTLPTRITHMRLLHGPGERGDVMLQVVFERINLPSNHVHYSHYDWGQPKPKES